MVKRASWLSVTPEPERELPGAVATLVCGRPPPPSSVDAERARIERLVLRGRERSWLRYLHRVVELIDARADSDDEAVLAARELAIDVVANHHNLLIALPGDGGARTAADRARLNHQPRIKGRT
jgi:hypothetical protein